MKGDREETGEFAAHRPMARMVVMVPIVAVGLLAGCPRDPVVTAAPSPPSVSASWSYNVRFDDGFETAHARVCFDGAAPAELIPGNHDAAPYLVSAYWAFPGPRRKLRPRKGRIALSGMPDDGCVEYDVSLGRAARDRSWGRLVRRYGGGGVLASPHLWLWRAAKRPTGLRAKLKLELPAGARASLPWRAEGDSYVLEARDFAFDGFAAFGALEQFTFSQSGCTFEVSVVGGADAPSREVAGQWLRTIAETVSGVLGRFPRERLQVIVAASALPGDPVQFGIVGRSGAGSVLLLLSQRPDLRQLLDHWVAPHEFSHLLLPFIERSDAWLPEGLATYYQEVLRVRAGVRSEEAAWARIVEAVDEASAQKPEGSMREESRRMSHSRRYRRVYWSGALFALIVDARLRHQSPGKHSLDSALAAAPWRGGSDRVWSAAEVLEALDRVCESDAFSQLARECLDEPWPSADQVLADLGVRRGAQGVVLDDSAPWADVRHAIMSKQAAGGR